MEFNYSLLWALGALGVEAMSLRVWAGLQHCDRIPMVLSCKGECEGGMLLLSISVLFCAWCSVTL